MKPGSIPHLRLALTFWLLVAVVAVSFTGSQALARTGLYGSTVSWFHTFNDELTRLGFYDDVAITRRNIWSAVRQIGNQAAPAHAQSTVPDLAPADAEQAARFADSLAPRVLADFVGHWSHHGFWLDVQPSGTADVGWRTYDRDTIAEPGGQAIITFTRAQDRTAYGVVSGSNDTRLLPNGPIRLIEHAYGVGELVSDGWADVMTSYRPFTVCGPRYGSAPDWLLRAAPCGA